jgi:hypothetical protein
MKHNGAFLFPKLRLELQILIGAMDFQSADWESFIL